MSREIVAVDIGGTHARFALARVAGGRVRALAGETILKTAEHASFQLAWEHFIRSLGSPAPRAAAIAVAAPLTGDVLKFTNNPWVIERALIAETLGVDDLILINDFGAVGHAVAQLPPKALAHVCGPDLPLSDNGMISILGPGTGLGVAALLRSGDHYHVVPTEGGHVEFAPIDAIDDALLAEQRLRYGRVSAERIVSGSGLVAIHHLLAGLEGRAVATISDETLWGHALAGDDGLAAAALDRFCLNLGSIAGDIALAHGSSAVVIAGGLGLRLAGHLPSSGFARRFVAKGRFEETMAAMPVKLVTHPQPGLYGAAAAFATRHRE